MNEVGYTSPSDNSYENNIASHFPTLKLILVSIVADATKNSRYHGWNGRKDGRCILKPEERLDILEGQIVNPFALAGKLEISSVSSSMKYVRLLS